MLARVPFSQKTQRWLVFGLALVVSLTVVLVVWRGQRLVDGRPDPYWFGAMGRSVARGEGFLPFGTLLHRRCPLYPLLIAGLYSVFGENDVSIQVVQALLFAGTCLLAFDMGNRLFNARTGLLAALACIFHPSFLRYVPDLHLETLFTFLVTLAVWFSIRLVEKPSLGRGLAFGVVLGLSALTKAVTLFYPIVFVGVWWFARRRFLPVGTPAAPSKSLLMLGGIFVAMGLTILPWTIRNYHATGGHIVPVTTGLSDAFLRGYVFSKTDYILMRRPPYTDGENEANAMFRELCAAEGTVWEKDDLETDKILNKAAKARLLASPGEFVRKSFVGLFTFWYEMTGLTTSLVAGSTALVAWLLAFVGLKRARKEGQPVWLLLTPVLYLNLLLAVLLSLGRYSVPILPCLLVVSAFGLDSLLDWRARKGQAGAAAGA